MQDHMSICPLKEKSIQHLFSYLRTQNVTETYSIKTFLRPYFPIAQINYLMPSVKQCSFQNALVPNRTMSKKTAEVNRRVISSPTLLKRYRVPVTVRRPIIVDEIFHGLLQYMKPNTRYW